MTLTRRHVSELASGVMTPTRRRTESLAAGR